MRFCGMQSYKSAFSSEGLTHFGMKDQLEVWPPLQLVVQILGVLQAFVDLSFKTF